MSRVNPKLCQCGRRIGDKAKNLLCSGCLDKYVRETDYTKFKEGMIAYYGARVEAGMALFEDAKVDDGSYPLSDKRVFGRNKPRKRKVKK